MLPRRARDLDIKDFPSYQAYQDARQMALYQERILTLRVAYPTMPPRELAARTGLPPHLVRDALGETDPPAGFRLQ